MIYDRFEHAAQYFKEGGPLHKAISYAANLDSSMADGKHEIEGDAIYALVMSYETSPAEKCRFEAHRKYIDLQVLFEGEERIDVSLEQNLRTLEEYSEENDVEFFESPTIYTSLVMKPGYFALFYPHDIHRPNCRLHGPGNARKVVVKVEI